MKTKILLSLLLAASLASPVYCQENWLQLPDFTPGKLGRAGAVAVNVEEKAYVGLGTGAIAPENIDGLYNDFWEFDPVTGSWEQRATFPGHPRQAGIAFSAGNKAYVGTGISNRSAFSDMYEYNPVENTWRQVADYPGGVRYTAMAFSIGNKGYVGGGKDQNFFYGTVDFYEFDPTIGETGTWTRKADISSIRRSTGVGFNVGQKGYIGLGMQDYDTRLSDLWEYDPSLDTWTRKSDFPTSPELGFGRWGAIAFTIGSKAYVGQGYYYEPHGDLWEYDPSADTWTEKTPLNAAGRGQAIAFSLGGRGYIGLGYNNSPDYLNDMWQFTPARDTEIICIEPQRLCYDSTSIYNIPAISIHAVCQTLDVTYIVSGATSRTGVGDNASGEFNPGISTITWQVNDCYGNTLTCSTTVTISRLTITIPDQFAVTPGGEANTLYKGYGPTRLTYQATVTGGVPFDDGTYQYLWSTGATTSAIQVSPNIPGKYVYAVTVTDKLNCIATQSIAVDVIDVTCGWRSDKVVVCIPHPRGRSVDVCVNPAAVAALLKHGGRLGDCLQDNPNNHPGECTVNVYPNPNKGAFMVTVNNLPSDWCEVRVMDRYGKTIDVKYVAEIESNMAIPFELSPNQSGLHIIKVLSRDGVRIYKVQIN